MSLPLSPSVSFSLSLARPSEGMFDSASFAMASEIGRRRRAARNQHAGTAVGIGGSKSKGKRGSSASHVLCTRTRLLLFHRLFQQYKINLPSTVQEQSGTGSCLLLRRSRNYQTPKADILYSKKFTYRPLLHSKIPPPPPIPLRIFLRARSENPKPPPDLTTDFSLF